MSTETLWTPNSADSIDSKDSLLSGHSIDSTFNGSLMTYNVSVLASDARARTLPDGYHGSLLRANELHNYYPDSKISIYMTTWNMNNNDPPQDLNPIVLPDTIEHVADIMVFGVQEAPGNALKDWEIDIQKSIGPSHVLLHSTTHGALHMVIFVKRFLIWYVSIPEDETHNTRSPCAIPILKTKGAIAVSFRVFGTSFLFINSHFPAHESQCQSRLEAYERIISSIELPKDSSLLRTRYITPDLTGRFDCVFWFGDLNFRIDLSHENVCQYLQLITSDDMYSQLLENDQLTQAMERNALFRGFSEAADIRFPPTYKFEINSNTYESVLKRVPSYTDRILYRSKRLGHIFCQQYNYVPHFDTSDHKPVFALFMAQIRHGRDDIPLNLGQFDREVYIEGLKRRGIEAGRKFSDNHDCVIS
ncbi:inositol polyphosphate 5-phosphatase E-like [Oppia nitens]|uniref:inositol polyphosphate 5-phosphatase E-like n=1 Tax=Oppia nitens TaxID=1686743 RepID=UPI0023DA4B80|nr:inositol polyphosphate 5-phosphatase E-like [Oppia nitens]